MFKWLQIVDAASDSWPVTAYAAVSTTVRLRFFIITLFYPMVIMVIIYITQPCFVTNTHTVQSQHQRNCRPNFDYGNSP